MNESEEHQSASDVRAKSAHTQPQARARAMPAGAEPSNTAPANSMGANTLVLRKGVDSLYLSVQGQLSAESEAQLSTLKSAAQSRDPATAATSIIVLMGRQFEVKATGSRTFKYVLQDHAYRIQVAGTNSGSLPLAYAKISSDYLATTSPKQAALEFLRITEALGTIEDAVRVSRADVFVDFTTPYSLSDWDEGAWVTRATKISRHTVGRRLSGWSIGLGGDLSARLYDKTLEIESSGKHYLKAFWHQAGWEPPEPVYRLEFQFEREQLKAHSALAVPTFLRNIGGLWSYAMLEWLRLSVPNEADSTRSRWPLHPLWSALAAVEWGGSVALPSKPVRVSNAPSEEALLTRFFSLLTSYMAAHGITDIDQALHASYSRLRDHYGGLGGFTGLTVNEMAFDKAALKAKTYGLDYGETRERSEYRQAEAVRNAHRRLNK
ncbi:MAG: hypothetical protein RJQ08_10305 [Salinisphaeraceae bacterium]